MRSSRGRVRLRSYLAPGLPHGLFEAIAEHLGAALGVEVDLEFDETVSGPDASHDEPFAGADLAFACAPSYVALREHGLAQLIPMAPVFDDSRAAGRPVYFSDVIVAAAHRATSIDELCDATWAVNDARSLSGYGCVVGALGDDVTCVWSGGHRSSVEFVRDGRAEAAAIDANALPYLDLSGLRVVATLGPHPVQPLIAAPGFDRVDDVAGALADLRLPAWHVTGFAPVTDADYLASPPTSR